MALRSIAAAIAAISLGWAAASVRADTFSFAAAMQREPGTVCYGWGDSGETDVGLFTEDCAGQRVIMPLYWRNFYFSWIYRTVNVRAKRADTSAQVSCTLYSVGSDGIVYSQDTESVTSINSYQWLVLQVNQVSSTSTSYISCSASGKIKIMNVEYSP